MRRVLLLIVVIGIAGTVVAARPFVARKAANRQSQELRAAYAGERAKLIRPIPTSASMADTCDDCHAVCNAAGEEAFLGCRALGGEFGECVNEGLCTETSCCASNCSPCGFCVESSQACTQ